MSAQSVVVPFPQRSPIVAPRAASNVRLARGSDAPVPCTVHDLQTGLSRSLKRRQAPEGTLMQGLLTALGLGLPVWAPLAIALLHR